MPVSLRVAQTLDLDSDGDREDRALAATTRTVPLARPAATIEPKDGKYVSAVNDDSIQVSQGAVTHYTFGGSCQAENKVHVPISPSDGTVMFVDLPFTGDPNLVTTATAQGDFTSNTGVELDITTDQHVVGGHSPALSVDEARQLELE